ncbi:unnamed protein product [Caenorhabditis brenneri]
MSTEKGWIDYLDDKFDVYVDAVSEAIFRYKYIFAIIGILINIFHLAILSKKQMRTTAINCILIGIALCDMYNMVYRVYDKFYLYIPYDECNAPYSYTRVVLSVIGDVFHYVLRFESAFLAVLMASIRVLVVKNPLNSKFDKLSTPKFAIQLMFILLIFSSIGDVFYYGRANIISDGYPVTPPAYCGYPENYTQIVWWVNVPVFIYGDLDLQILNMFSGVATLIPASTLPVLSVLLIKEVRNAAKARKNFLTSQQSLDKAKANHLTMMLSIMTTASMIAEGPLGLVKIVKSFQENQLGPSNVLDHLIEILTYLPILNTYTHCIVSLAVSSQYQNTVLEVFPCIKAFQKKPQVIIVEPSSNQGTRGSFNSRA